MEGVKWLGDNKMILKSDKEPAIAKFLTEALTELRIEGVSELLVEHPPEYGPQSNSSGEAGVKLLTGWFRTVRSGLDGQPAYRVSVRHPMIAWMMKPFGNLIIWCQKDHEGSRQQDSLPQIELEAVPEKGSWVS